MAFIDDIQSRDTALFPVVEIHTPQLNDISESGAALSDDLSEGSTGFYPDDWYAGWSAGQYIKIDNEIMRIWIVVQIIRVDRGLFGTAIENHSAGAIIYRVGWIKISTKDFALENFYYDYNDSLVTLSSLHYKPLLLSTPSIKESIDLENRKYKISNVSLKISNVEYNGLRFTDTQIPLNTEVLIHWVSPSCTYLGECYLAYKGTVRAITHDEKTCNITLEDISQSTLHRDVPVASLGTGIEIPDKYRNKPIPMVYGTVDISPCVIGHNTLSEDLSDGSYEIWADSVASSTKINATYNPDTNELTNDPLYIYRNDEYLNILHNIQEQTEYWGDISVGAGQYYIENFNKIIISAYSEWFNTNLISFDQCQVRLIKYPSNVLLNPSGDQVYPDIEIYYGGELSNINNLLTGEETTTGTGNMYFTDAATNIYTPTFTFSFNINDNDIVGNVNSYLNLKADIIFDHGDYADDIETWAHLLGTQFRSQEYWDLTTGEGTKYFWQGDRPEDDVLYTYDYSNNVTREYFLYQKTISGVVTINHPIYFYDPILGNMPVSTDFTLNIDEFAIECIFEVDKLNSSDFYANVKGRTSP